MSAKPCRLRLSPALRELVDAVSLNASAAQRALLLLGANAAGYDLSACRADLGRLLGEQLDPPVRAAIDALYDADRYSAVPLDHRRPTVVPHVSYERPTPGPQADHMRPTTDSETRDAPLPLAPAMSADDPLASVGIEV